MIESDMPDKTTVQSMPPLSSHDRILMAGKRLFALNGYENTSTVAISREAGTSESQMMKHFGSKQGLLAAIFDRGWAAIAERVQMAQKSASLTERLFGVLEAIAIELDNDSDLKEIMLLEAWRVRKDNRDVLLSQGFQRICRCGGRNPERDEGPRPNPLGCEPSSSARRLHGDDGRPVARPGGGETL